jgi:hypothetical protein
MAAAALPAPMASPAISARRSCPSSRHLPPPPAAIKRAHYRRAPLFLPPPPLHRSCAAPNTVMLVITEPPQTTRSSPSTTVLNRPRALVQRRVAPRPSRLPPQPPVLASTVISPSAAKHLHADGPLRPHFGPVTTTSSSTSTPGAPSTTLLVPSAVPLLHHRRSPPLSLHHRGTPCSGEPSPLIGHQSDPPPCRLALRPLHRRPPAAGRPDFVGKSPVPTGEKTSPVAASGRKAEMGWASPIRMGRATVGAAQMNNAFCYFSFELIQFIPIQISEFHRNLFICQ